MAIRTRLPVYIIPDVSGGDVNTVRNIFSDPFFNVSFVQDEAAATPEQREKQLVLRALSDGRKSYPESPLFIVKDTSISSAPSDEVAKIIKLVISNAEANPDNRFHAFYACVWLDRCELYTGKNVVSDTGAFTAFTESPYGLQAVLFSPQGRDVILGHTYMDNNKLFDINGAANLGEAINRETFRGNLRVECVYPNIIDYNISAAETTDDLLKGQRCLPIPPRGGASSKKNVKNTTSLSPGAILAILIIVIVLIVLLLLWMKSRGNGGI